MDGIFIKGRRPATKKAIKDAVAADPSSVEVESTSFFGGWSGSVADLPVGTRIDFVGPDPRTKRNFYGSLERKGDKVTVK